MQHIEETKTLAFIYSARPANCMSTPTIDVSPYAQLIEFQIQVMRYTFRGVQLREHLLFYLLS